MLSRRKIAIIGGGPSALMILKNFVDSKVQLDIDVFEKHDVIGSGMPYSNLGAEKEHDSNVSAEELPLLVAPFDAWLTAMPQAVQEQYAMMAEASLEVIPRLLLGQYLSDQFLQLRDMAAACGINVNIHLHTAVNDIIYVEASRTSVVQTPMGTYTGYDKIVICTGHRWPLKQEGKVPRYFDSPYPPAKLKLVFNHPVCLKGSSLTAIDAIRTLARMHGKFSKDGQGKLTFTLSDSTPDFRLVMYSIGGLLPAVRFYVKKSTNTVADLLGDQKIASERLSNGGFLSLDTLFRIAFKNRLRDMDPDIHREIDPLSIEEFVSAVMGYRQSMDAFELLEEEVKEGRLSFRTRRSVVWKELISSFSYVVNYPAKYLSAEDTLRLHDVLAPLIGIVIAFMPHSSAAELIALREAGILDLVSVDSTSQFEPDQDGGVRFRTSEHDRRATRYQSFVDCVGQKHFDVADFPFHNMKAQAIVSQAYIEFRSDEAGRREAESNEDVSWAGNHYALKVSGVTINDVFNPVGPEGVANEDIHIMAVPYIGGYNPDYSGLDFCETAGSVIVNAIIQSWDEQSEKQEV